MKRSAPRAECSPEAMPDMPETVARIPLMAAPKLAPSMKDTMVRPRHESCRRFGAATCSAEGGGGVAEAEEGGGNAEAADIVTDEPGRK